MKASDLRIGNYVYYENTTHIVSGVHGNKVYSWWVKDGQPVIEYEAKDISGTQVENPYIDVVSQYEPIPLTDEWLLKFGFEKQDYELILKVNDYGCLVYWHKEMFLMMGQFADCTDIVPCESLHQLQNLYFALTGEELKLK